MTCVLPLILAIKITLVLESIPKHCNDLDMTSMLQTVPQGLRNGPHVDSPQVDTRPRAPSVHTCVRVQSDGRPSAQYTL